MDSVLFARYTGGGGEGGFCPREQKRAGGGDDSVREDFVSIPLFLRRLSPKRLISNQMSASSL